MATKYLWFGDLLRPNPTGGVIPQPSSILDANDLYPVDILAYPDGSTKIGATVKIQVPDNYASTPVIGIEWKAIPTTGDVVWDVDLKAIAQGESLDPSSHDQSSTVTDTASGTARLRNVATIAVTATLVIGDFLYITISRDLADGNDTMAGTAELVDAYLSYSDT